MPKQKELKKCIRGFIALINEVHDTHIYDTGDEHPVDCQLWRGEI